jgi:hypothetical protein
LQGEYRLSFMVSSHPMGLSVQGTSPDIPEQRDVQDSAIMRNVHKWPIR